MRILVATLAFGDPAYFPYALAINQHYCSMHGYDLRIVDACADRSRLPVWGKVSGVRSLLSLADYVLFLDADAYFVDHQLSIESLIRGHLQTACVLMGTDRRDKNYAWSDVNGNTGVFLVRNCELAQEILGTWWRAPTHYDRRWLRKWPPDQAAFNYVVRPLFREDAIRVIPYQYMNGRDGGYIRHLIGMSTDERVRILRHEVSRLLP